MAFDEVRLPEEYSYGARGGPGFNTEILRSAGGVENRNSRWGDAKAQYNIGYSIRDLSDISGIVRFFYARRGAKRGFRFKDFTDYQTTPDGRNQEHGGSSDVALLDQWFGTGDGSTKSFQLTKSYTSGSQSYLRLIRKPVDGTVLIGLANVLQTSGFVIDYTTGIVTFTTAPADQVLVTWGGEFDVPVRFGETADQGIEAAITSFSEGSIPDIPLVEDWSAIANPEVFPYGGAKDWGNIAASVAASLSLGRVHVATPTVAGLYFQLPSPDELPFGGPAFIFVNNSTTQTIGLRIAGASSDFLTIAAMSGVVAGSANVYIVPDSSGNPEYLAF